jgi:multidrug resistance efflux pump
MTKKIVLISSVLILAALSLSACSTPIAAAQTVTNAQVPAGTSAEGRVLPLQSTTLSFNASGQVAEIVVKEGDSVKAGDVIARLKNEVLQATVAEAQAGVESAKAAQTNYQRQLPQQIAAAEAAMKAAQAQQLSASAGRNQQAAILEAESTLAQTQYNQQQLQTVLDQLSAYDRANGSRANDLRLQLQSARDATRAAQAQLAALQTGSPSDRANAAQVNAAAAQVAAAQAQLDQLQAEATGKAADTYGAAIQQAEASLLSAQQALSQTEIRAPFAGTVAQINLKLGEQVEAGTAAVVLADLSGWQIETKDLTEIKVPLVKVGQAVIVTFDALPDLELNGTVESISGVSQLNGGDVVYPVRVSLLDGDPRLRWGMTAVVQFQP